MRCRERSGFLFAHRCSYPVRAHCAQCQKPVCQGHVRRHGDQNLCITCYKQVAQPPARQEAARAVRGQYSYYDDPFWYASYHYSSYGYYDSSDYGVFDREADAAAHELAEDWEAS